MFFKRKDPNNQYTHLSNQLAALTQDIAAVHQRLDVLQTPEQTLQMLGQNLGQLENSMNQSLGQLESRFDRLHSDVHRHDMAIEDLLDEWEDKKSDEEDVKEQLMEASQTEKLLLALFEAYQEQFWNLRHYAASKDETWTAQLALMEKNLERFRRSCAISVIQDCGVHVDYDLHEIIEALDTKDPAQDKTIAEIYRCGYLYKGKVQKKAQACAYRFSNPAS